MRVAVQTFFGGWVFTLILASTTSAAIELTEVDLNNGVIELTNTSGAVKAVDLLEWCIPFSYSTLESTAAFAPGETRVYNLGVGSFGASDDLWIYRNRTGGFGDTTKVITGIVWGSVKKSKTAYFFPAGSAMTGMSGGRLEGRSRPCARYLTKTLSDIPM